MALFLGFWVLEFGVQFLGVCGLGNRVLGWSMWGEAKIGMIQDDEE